MDSVSLRHHKLYKRFNCNLVYLDKWTYWAVTVALMALGYKSRGIILYISGTKINLITKWSAWMWFCRSYEHGGETRSYGRINFHSQRLKFFNRKVTLKNFPPKKIRNTFFRKSNFFTFQISGDDRSDQNIQRKTL